VTGLEKDMTTRLRVGALIFVLGIGTTG